MLLPSDIARLVLGYLEQEGLCNTVQAFIVESPSLKEYGSLTRSHGGISTCAFSLFGKDLTAILAEYVKNKATESRQAIEAPAMMTSLWKKLDITLNEIRCLQTSLTLPEDQRCSKTVESGRDAASRTSKMRDAAEPKSSKRRKMAHPLPVRKAQPSGREAPPTPEGNPAFTSKATLPATSNPAASSAPSCLASLSSSPDGPKPSKITAGCDEDDATSALYQPVCGVASRPELRAVEHSRSAGHGRQGDTASPPDPRNEPPQKPTPDTGTAVASLPDSATEGEPVAPLPSDLPLGPRPQSHKRMLCFEVPARNSETPKLTPRDQRASGPTFRWMKPPASDGTGAGGSGTPAEAADRGVETEESPAGDGEYTCCPTAAARGPRIRTPVESGHAGDRDSPVRKSRAGEGPGRGKDRDRAKVRAERDTQRRSRKVLGSRGQAGEPPRLVPQVEKRDRRKPGSRAAAPSGARVRSPEPRSSVGLRQTSDKASVLVRQVSEILRDIREQSPAPSPSKPLPLPRTPDPDRQATSLPLPWDPVSPGGPAYARSPASTGSPVPEMAASALMILSHAIVARSGTSPRCSSHQGAPQACHGGLRLQDEPLANPACVKQLRFSANGTKAKPKQRRKRRLDTFPDDLDVDKFLSSLHYDE